MVHIEAIRELLSTEEKGECVTTVVGVMNLADLDCVVCQVVVDNEWEVLAVREETENAAIVVEELLLGGNLAATKGFLEELLHLWVSLWWDLDQGSCEVVDWTLLCWSEVNALATEELSSVVICVVDAHNPAEDGDVEADTEVLGQEGGLRAVWLHNHLALEEGTLRGSRVDHLWLGYHH